VGIFRLLTNLLRDRLIETVFRRAWDSPVFSSGAFDKWVCLRPRKSENAANRVTWGRHPLFCPVSGDSWL